MTPFGRAVARLCLVALLATRLAAWAGEAGLYAPEGDTFRASDRPSDDGSTVAVTWGKSDSERKGVDYILEIASEADRKAGTFKEAARIPADKGLKADAPKYFGFSPDHKNVHYAGVEPATVYKPDKAKLRKEVVADEGKRMRQPWAPDTDFFNALARLSTDTSHTASGIVSLNEMFAGPDATPLPTTVMPAPGTAMPPQPVDPIAEARMVGAQYATALKGFVDYAGKLAARGAEDSQEKLRIAETSFTNALEGMDEQIYGVLRLRDKYRRALRRVDAKHLTSLEEFERGFHHSLKAYRDVAERLKKFETYVSKRLAKRLKTERQAVNGRAYAFRLGINDGQRTVYVQEGGSAKVAEGRARVNWFKGFKVNNLVYSLVFCAIVGAFIQAARRNPNLFIRKIAGLDAVEEAIGRATEMGRGVFFVHGLGGMGGLPTIAAVNILGRVARRAAEYDTRIRVMNNEPIVMAVSQEVVKQSYTEAGRPDAYSDDDVALVASDQFSYAAAVGGRMVRERPAAVFFMGSFAAESLILAETGASTGAIQIAGTDSYTQIPFFITTCDYTLIGEELYAASAYLSREPKMLGSLRGQDVGKALMMVVMLLFTGLATLGYVLSAKLPALQALIDYWAKTLFHAFS